MQYIVGQAKNMFFIVIFEGKLNKLGTHHNGNDYTDHF